MKIIGDLKNPKVMLVHGAGFNWENCFGKIIASLKKDFCFLIPILPGHCDEKKGLMDSVEETAKEICKQIYGENIKEIKTLYGVSLGASVALEIALNNMVKINKLILDGGQYVSMGDKTDFFSKVMSKQFLGLLAGEHLQKEIRENMGYTDNDVDVLRPMLYKSLTENVLYSAFIAAYNYDITKKNEKLLSSEVMVTFGSKEIYAKNSSLLLRQLSDNELLIKEMDNMGHSEALSKHPDLIIDLIKY